MPDLAVTKFVNTTAGSDENADADELNENFDDIVDLLGGTKSDDSVVAGALDEDNFKRIPETKIVFSNTGHAHAGAGNDGTLIQTGEANITWDSAGGHDHDDAANPGSMGEKLALAADNGYQGALKVVSGTEVIAEGASAEIDLETTHGLEEWYKIYVYSNNVGEGNHNKGIGGSNYDSTAPGYLRQGYYWKLSGDDYLTLTIHNVAGEGTDTTFNWLAIGK